jgi:hypothetical protein
VIVEGGLLVLQYTKKLFSAERHELVDFYIGSEAGIELPMLLEINCAGRGKP